MNTTLEIPEGSKATIQGKVIDGKYYLVVEVENEEQELKEGDLAIFWDFDPSCAKIMPYGYYRNGIQYAHVTNSMGNYIHAVKWDGTKEHFEKVLRGELK